jgi:polar amino acid transport system substrate-binding protein
VRLVDQLGLVVLAVGVRIAVRHVLSRDPGDDPEGRPHGRHRRPGLPAVGRGQQAGERLGYTDAQVTWIRTGFDEVIKPGAKNFDFNIQQFSINDQRKKAVDFSSPYYEVTQAVVSYEGSPISGATTVAELKDAKLGAAVGTTSLKAIESSIAPTQQAQVFNDNAAAVTALKNKQIDGLVVDLPTAFYLAGAEIDKGKIVGQLPNTAGSVEPLGLLLAKNSPITTCVSGAVDALRTDGTLAKLEDQYLAQAGAPVLK